MTFVQVIEYETTSADKVDVLLDQWIEATRGRRTAKHEMHMRDRENMTHFVDIVEFPSYEEAMKNNDLPETRRIAEQLRDLCANEPRFVNLDVMRDDRL
jgi:hypothetical protein